MYARERIIRDRFAKRSCGRCGAQYTSESVVVLARRPSHWMVMVSCPHCSHRNVYLISFADADSSADLSSPDGSRGTPSQLFPSIPAEAGADSPDAETPYALPPAPGTHRVQPISEDDVAAMHDFLQDFSGDFRTLFSTPRPRQHPHRKDDPPTS